MSLSESQPATDKPSQDGVLYYGVLHCYPGSESQPPRPGDRALCGHVREKAWVGGETGSRCVVCVDLLHAIDLVSAGEQR